jgi:hypothetical protein
MNLWRMEARGKARMYAHTLVLCILSLVAYAVMALAMYLLAWSLSLLGVCVFVRVLILDVGIHFSVFAAPVLVAILCIRYRVSECAHLCTGFFIYLFYVLWLETVLSTCLGGLFGTSGA